MLLWANLHGGFTLGLMLCGFFALEAVVTAGDAAQRRFLFVEWLKFGVAAVLVACITPYGPESMLVTLRIFGLGEALSLIKEWQSPDFQNLPMQELMLLAAIFGALACGLKLPVLRLLLVLGLLHLFLKHARNIELLAVLAPLAVAPILARQWPSLRPDSGAFLAPGARPAGPARTLALSFAALFAACMIKLANIQPPTDTTPVAALEFAQREKLQGPVFNDYDFGGFLIHAGIPTFIDGRGELFGGDFIKRYADAIKPARRRSARAHARSSRHRMDAPAQRPAGQQAAGAAAGLAPRLPRRDGDHLRADSPKSSQRALASLGSTIQPLARFCRVAEDRQRAAGIDFAERFGQLLLELRPDDNGDRADRSRLGELKDLL